MSERCLQDKTTRVRDF